MNESILNSTKKILGISEDYTAFDVDILTHINSTFFTLSQLGIGPTTGFMIEDAEAQWVDFLGTDLNLNAVKTYMFLCVRLLFDPPNTSYLITALNEQKRELEWRLNTYREGYAWTAPPPLPGELYDDDEITVVDGGSPY